MSATALLAIAAACAIGGVAVLRLSWSRATRSTPWNAAGWALIALSGFVAWQGAGAWGVSVAALWGMGAAVCVLTHAVLTAPAASAAKASNRRAGMLPEGKEPLRLGRRIATFVLVALVAMIVSAGVGTGVHDLAIVSGASEANAVVIGFFAMPLIWAVLAYVLLMEHSRLRQARLLAICTVVGAAAIVTGLVA